MKRNNKILPAEGGHSLVELILVIVLLGILVGFSFQFLSGGIDTYIVARDIADTSQQGKIALERIAREARFARQSTISITTGSISFTKFTGTPLDTNLDVTFSLSNGNLRRTSGGTAVTLAENVTSFIPSQDSDGDIKLQLTLEKGDGRAHFQTLVYPRNQN